MGSLVSQDTCGNQAALGARQLVPMEACSSAVVGARASSQAAMKGMWEADGHKCEGGSQPSETHEGFLIGTFSLFIFTLIVHTLIMLIGGGLFYGSFLFSSSLLSDVVLILTFMFQYFSFMCMYLLEIFGL